MIYLQSTGVLLKGGSHVCRWDLGTAAVPLWCQYARCTSQLIAQLSCRLKHRTFSSNDLRDCDFSERKDDALKLHRTIEVGLYTTLASKVVQVRHTAAMAQV